MIAKLLSLQPPELQGEVSPEGDTTNDSGLLRETSNYVTVKN